MKLNELIDYCHWEIDYNEEITEDQEEFYKGVLKFLDAIPYIDKTLLICKDAVSPGGTTWSRLHKTEKLIAEKG